MCSTIMTLQFKLDYGCQIFVWLPAGPIACSLQVVGLFDSFLYPVLHLKKCFLQLQALIAGKKNLKQFYGGLEIVLK